MNSVRKIVFSRSLLDASAWNNSVVADEGLRQTIAKEKSEAGKDMVIFAGAKFASTDIREGLVDEYLLTIPMLFGGGSRLFDGGESVTAARCLNPARC
jgi:dihydrofolate reductase